MLSQIIGGLNQAQRVVFQQFRRNLGVSAAIYQKAEALDPIQQLFLSKIREYKQKSVGGKLVDASPETEKDLTAMMEKLERQYSAKGQDFTKFPTFSFSDVALESVGVQTESKEAVEQVEEVDADAQSDDKNRPWFVL